MSPSFFRSQLKTSSPIRPQLVFDLPFFSQPSLCPARTLEAYLTKTQFFRRAHGLLLCCRPPLGPAAVATNHRPVVARHLNGQRCRKTVYVSLHAPRGHLGGETERRASGCDFQGCGFGTQFSSVFARHYLRACSSTPSLALRCCPPLRRVLCLSLYFVA